MHCEDILGKLFSLWLQQQGMLTVYKDLELSSLSYPDLQVYLKERKERKIKKDRQYITYRNNVNLKGTLFMSIDYKIIYFQFLFYCKKCYKVKRSTLNYLVETLED